MPTSNLHLAPYIISDAGQSPPRDRPKRVLDIGPGFGKYGVLIREYWNTKPEALDALEAWEPYVTPMMKAIYDEVIIGRAEEQGQSFFSKYDLILMIDVLEHIEKEAALDMLWRMKNRVLICTPRDWFESVDYPPTEKHVSHWTKAEFRDEAKLGRKAEILYVERGGIVCRLGPLKI